MSLDTASPDDVITSELWNSVVGLLNGTSGHGNPVIIQQLDSPSVYGLHVNNIDTTNGLAAKFTYGLVSGPTTIMTVAKAAITVNAPILPTGSTLSLASTAGNSVSIVQSGFTQDIIHGLRVAKAHHASGASADGSAAAQFSLITWDATTPGVDTTTLKLVGDASGSSTGVDSTLRGLEIQIGRFASNATTTANGYSVGTATPADYGSTRGIAIGLYHDPLIVDTARDTFSLTGIDISNVGSGGVAGRTWASGGNKGTAGVNIWGAAGFTYGILYGGPTMADQLIGTVTGRVFHVREAGGVDQMYLWSASTVGTGMQFRNTSGTQFDRALTVQGSGGSHPGALSIWNANDARYMLMAWKSLTTTTIDQILAVSEGTAAVPVWSWSTDLDTGVFHQAANNIGFSTGGTEAIRITDAQLVDFRVGTIAMGGGAAPTVGTIGGSGPAAAGQSGWLKVLVGGTASYIPYWR